MNAKILFFDIWKIRYDFLDLRHLAVCTKTFFYLFFNCFLYFWKFLPKTGYFNTGFIFLWCKIQTDIKQTLIENKMCLKKYKNYNKKIKINKNKKIKFFCCFWDFGQCSLDFNKLVIKAKMHAKIMFFFWHEKYDMIF